MTLFDVNISQQEPKYLQLIRERPLLAHLTFYDVLNIYKANVSDSHKCFLDLYSICCCVIIMFIIMSNSAFPMQLCVTVMLPSEQVNIQDNILIQC